MSDSDHDLEVDLAEAMWQANYECDWVANRPTVELCARVARAAVDRAVAAEQDDERKLLLVIQANLDGFEVPQTLDLIDERLAALRAPQPPGDKP